MHFSMGTRNVHCVLFALVARRKYSSGWRDLLEAPLLTFQASNLQVDSLGLKRKLLFIDLVGSVFTSAFEKIE